MSEKWLQIPFDLVSFPLFEHFVCLVEIVSESMSWDFLLISQLDNLPRLNPDLSILDRGNRFLNSVLVRTGVR